jgi:UDP-GlcNAc:undecaprenyl-phosphate GlcNAc-1-phosphate transferase
MNFKYFLTILISVLLGIIGLSWLRKFSLRYKILVPNGIPFIGGVAMGISFLFTCLFVFSFYKSLSNQIIGILFASFIILIMGVIDDFRELSVTIKFLLQILATALVILFGVRTNIVYIGNFLNIIITFIWIIGITNAFNLLDIKDGLSGGTALIVSLAFLVITSLNGDINTVIIILSLIGAVASFLIYNLPPAKIYMGNTGSHFLGFVLGTIAITISYAPLERKIALISPILILGFPIFDTMFLIFMRLGKKKLPFKKTKDHLAIRFSALGYSGKKTLFIMLLVCLCFASGGLLLSQVSNFFGIIIIIFSFLLVFFLTKKMINVVIDG